MENLKLRINKRMKLDLGTIVIIKKEQTFTENYFDGEITYTIRKGEEGVVCDYDERGAFVEFEANEAPLKLLSAT